MSRTFVRSLAVALFVSLAFTACEKTSDDRVQGYAEGEFVYVSSPLGGTLEQLFVRRGEQVRAGQPLFTLDETMERAARDQAQAALVLSEADFKRQEQLFQSGPAAAQDFDRARAARDQDRERLAQAKWNLAQMQQSAPKAGLVYDTLFREGEWVAAGKPIVQLLPPPNIKVRAFVPETRIGSLQVGEEARVTVDGVAAPFVGRISYISPRAEYTPPVIYSRESRSKLVFMVEIRFDPEVAVKLHPGQPVDVEFVRQ
ncbi:MAG TPA: efflux RND transporter periplasmic adaptor subunit [Chthoniobacterales bacterium]